MAGQRQWVVKDIGPFPSDEERVWGPFKTKKAAAEFGKNVLCDCCPHKVIPLYSEDNDVDWRE